jgi:acyl-coenzyme A thioesterase PaaI-like protein
MPSSNQLSRRLASLNRLPAFLRPTVVSFLLGRLVPLVGTASLRFEELSSQRVVVSIRNRRPVQNHIQGVHAAAMALLAETATGFCVGMNLPDDKLPLIKSLKVSYVKRAVGGMRAVAELRPEQVQQILTQDKGEVTVPVSITDESGGEPIQCEMVWAWVPKQRKAA